MAGSRCWLSSIHEVCSGAGYAIKGVGNVEVL